jgi:hypothetical protein
MIMQLLDRSACPTAKTSRGLGNCQKGLACSQSQDDSGGNKEVCQRVRKFLRENKTLQGRDNLCNGGAIFSSHRLIEKATESNRFS